MSLRTPPLMMAGCLLALLGVNASADGTPAPGADDRTAPACTAGADDGRAGAPAEGPIPVPFVGKDGRIDPDRVPDRLAFQVLFRTLAMARDAREQAPDLRRAHSLLGPGAFSEPEIAALSTVAREFHERVGLLERKAASVAKSAGRSDRAALRLSELRDQQEQFTSELLASLPGRLGQPLYEKLQRHCSEQLKPRITIFRQGR